MAKRIKIKNSFFNFETAQAIIDRLKNDLKYPFISARLSTLGGKENSTILLTYSTEPKEKWINNIFENSNYRRFSIDNDGTVENFVCSGLQKVRKFNAKSIDNLIEKLNK